MLRALPEKDTPTAQPSALSPSAPDNGTVAPRALARLVGRVRVALAAVVAGVLGVAPHVLHHVGPLAGAALFAGVGGTVVFGILGFLLAIPTLIKLHRHTGGWRAPAGALALMAVVFSLSAFVIGPAITGSDSGDTARTPSAAPADRVPAPPEGHSAHH